MSALNMTRHFLDRGHRCFCLCKRDGELHKNLHREGLPHRFVKVRSHYSPASMLKVRKLVSRDQISVVHCHFLHDLWLVSPALWRMPWVKLFATCHMLFSRTKKKDWAHRLLYGRLDKLIALTQIAKEFHVKCLPVPPEDVVVIPNGVDLNRFSRDRLDEKSIRDELGIPEADPVVGCIGRLDQGKGQEELICATREVVAAFPNCRFLIVGDATRGEGESFVARLRDLISEFRLENNVILTGFRADTPRILKALDVFAFPSYKETFGMSLLEAMAAGVPVIASDSGGVPEILDYGRCGILVPPREVQPLAQAIIRYLRDPQLAQKMTHNARRRVEQEYDLKLILDRIEKLYLDSPI
jgi:glycosyltransferase involved in cell wall biosynthesis